MKQDLVSVVLAGVALIISWLVGSYILLLVNGALVPSLLLGLAVGLLYLRQGWRLSRLLTGVVLAGMLLSLYSFGVISALTRGVMWEEIHYRLMYYNTVALLLLVSVYLFGFGIAWGGGQWWRRRKAR